MASWGLYAAMEAGSPIDTGVGTSSSRHPSSAPSPSPQVSYDAPPTNPPAMDRESTVMYVCMYVYVCEQVSIQPG